MRIQFSTITFNVKDFVKRINNTILHTSNLRDNIDCILKQWEFVIQLDCKHNMYVISSEV